MDNTILLIRLFHKYATINSYTGTLWYDTHIQHVYRDILCYAILIYRDIWCDKILIWLYIAIFDVTRYSCISRYFMLYNTHIYRGISCDTIHIYRDIWYYPSNKINEGTLCLKKCFEEIIDSSSAFFYYKTC